MTPLDRYTAMLRGLLPKGRLWEPSNSSLVTRLLQGIAKEMVRIDDKARSLLNEIDPRSSTELLPDWERIVGLPDECQAIADSIGQRRLDAHRKLTGRGGQNAEYFIQLAAAFGYTIRVRNLLPFRAGKGRCGDEVWGAEALFWWEVFSEEFTPVFFRAGQSSCGDALQEFRNEIMECVIRRAAPEHTNVLFVYGE